MTPMAIPALAPVDIPLLEELEESVEAEEPAVLDAAATSPVLVLPRMPVEVVETTVGAIRDAEVEATVL